MAYQRSIDLAFDRKSQRLLDANEIFKVAKSGYEVRTQYNSGELDLYCLDCEQDLMVSDSKNDQLHFKHLPHAGYCDLKDGKMSPVEAQLYTDILRGKESDRHKYLKNHMAELLLNTQGIDKDSVIADTKFFFSESEKRRPDVYCKYFDKELVFEIQLSQLSQRYILSRHNFYKSKGIYLIWILDNFDVYSQSKMERDIKYLAPCQNFFRLDEREQGFKLLCTYKSPFVTDGKNVISPWQKKSVALSELTFDPSNFQAYLLNYEKQLALAENKLAAILKADRDHELAKRQEQEKLQGINKADAVFNKLRAFKERGYNFYKFHEELDGLNEFGLKRLNEKLGFIEKRHKGKTLLHHYIATVVKGQHTLIDFLLREHRIKLHINAQNDDGTTCFQEIYKSVELDNKAPLLKHMFMRGYCLTAADQAFFYSDKVSCYDKEAEAVLFRNFERLKTKSLADNVQRNSGIFNIIESARQQKIIGFRFKNWISFGVHAAISYRKFWYYTQRAFKHYGLWEIILAADKKGSFREKARMLESYPNDDGYMIHDAIRELYPEIL